MSINNNLVQVEGLRKYFPVHGGVFRRKVADIKAVDGVSLHIDRGEVLGLVGETGSGKTTVARSILRLVKQIESGRVLFNGQDVYGLRGRELTELRRHMQIIFDNPHNAIDLAMAVVDIIGEPLSVHKMTTKENQNALIIEMLSLVGLQISMAGDTPQRLKAAERQRIQIARALIMKPDFIACDDPASMLPEASQEEIINLLARLRKAYGLAFLFIAHDLTVIRRISDRVAVMYLGRIVETARTDELFSNPQHPYTQAIFSTELTIDTQSQYERRVIRLPGDLPRPIDPPKGCHFHPRCPRAIASCRESEQLLKDLGDGHWVACQRV